MHNIENLVRVRRDERNEVLGRNLARHGIHHGDHVRARIHIRLRHLASDRRAIPDHRPHIVGMVVHLHEQVVAHQMHGQRERPAQEPVNPDPFTDARFHPPGDLESEGKPSGRKVKRWQICQRAVRQRMGLDRRRRFVGPHQFTPHRLGLELQIEQHRYSIRPILLSRRRKPADERVRRAEILRSLHADELAAMHPHKRHPGRTWSQPVP